VQSLCSSLLNLKLFSTPNFSSKLKFFEIQIWNYQKVSNEKIPKTNIVDFDELYNFVSDIISIFYRLIPQTFISNPNNNKRVTD